MTLTEQEVGWTQLLQQQPAPLSRWSSRSGPCVWPHDPGCWPGQPFLLPMSHTADGITVLHVAQVGYRG